MLKYSTFLAAENAIKKGKMVIFITDLARPDDGIGCCVYAVNTEKAEGFPWTPNLMIADTAIVSDEKDIEFVFPESSIFVDVKNIKQVEIYK